MTTSPHRTDRSWAVAPEPEPGSLVEESSRYTEGPDSATPVSASGSTAREPQEAPGAPDGRHAYDTRDEGITPTIGEYVAMPGMPARGIVFTSVLAAGACACLDLLLTNAITMFFDLCFIVVCLVSAMAVRRRDFFTTGVLPPLLFGAVVAVVAVRSPATFVQAGGISKAFMTGLAEHATALVVGYAIVLGTLGGRISAARTR